MKQFLFALLAMFVCLSEGYANKLPPDNPPYKNEKLPVEDRVADLLSRMTLEEKIEMLGGTGFATTPIERLGIPELRMTDGPIGVRWGKATALPSGIAMAATWEPALIAELGKALARETKAKGRHVILGPCVNIARIPQGGRNFESFGEDPYLTTQMTIPYIRGVQSENVVATVKHFALNNQEHQRDFVDVKIDTRPMYEIYLPAFQAAVRDADVWAFMCSYNRVNGHYASENDHLLVDILKNQWGFNYLVMSDWGAVHSSIPVARGGLDLEMPDGKYLNKKVLLEAVQSGQVAEALITDKVRRILRVIFKIGLFENPGEKDSLLLGTEANRNAALQTERSAIVLLKNNDNILPINKDKVTSIALIGPGAVTLRTGGGGSSQVEPLNPISPLDALKKELGSAVTINFAEGVKMTGDAKPIEKSFLFTDMSLKKHGLIGEYFTNTKFEGNPVLTRVDEQINFDWAGDAPTPELPADKFSIRWKGCIKVEKSGEYVFETLSDDGQRLYVDGKLIIDDWTDHAFSGKTARVTLEAGKPYSLIYEFYENGGSAAVRLAWNTPHEKLIADAVNVASASDIAIVMVGSTPNVESEGKDRDDLKLTDEQDVLIERVSQANKNTIVVLTTGSPVVMDNWLPKVKAVVETWFGGEMMGVALAEVLTGKVNPSGKLPVTFPKKWEDCSAYDTYKAMDSVTYYSDGIYVGYRHFEKKNIKPLFPFGYGLSYTTFAFSDAQVVPASMEESGKVSVSCIVSNTGTVAGAEVVQLYVKDEESSVDRPVKELKGFQKVYLQPGEKKQVTFTVEKDALAFYDVQTRQWVAEPGLFTLMIGSSSEDIKLTTTFTLK